MELLSLTEPFFEKSQQLKAIICFYKKLHHRSLIGFQMRRWWELLLVTERALPIKQRLFSVLAKKTQHLFLTMAVPIKCMIKRNVENEKSCLCAWKIKQRKPNETKTWICRQGIILFVPMHPFVPKQVFCCPIHCRSQNPDKSLKSFFFFDNSCGKNSIFVKNL